MGGKDCRNAVIAALSLAVLAGAACARNNEEQVGANPSRNDTAMGNRPDTTMKSGAADTSYGGAKKDTTMKAPTTSTSTSDTSSQMSNPTTNPRTDTSSTTTTSPSTGTTNPSTGTTNPSSGTTSPSTGSTTTTPPSSGSTSTNPSSSTSTSTSTPQASGPSAAGYSYEPSVAAPAAATAGAAQQQLTDANILAMLDQADMADSASGAVAMQKASNAQVKDYGRMMTRDHHQSRAKGQKLAKDLKITPQAPSDNPIAVTAKQDAAKLQSTASGDQFDRTYIEQQVAMHQQVIELAKQAQQTTKNEQLRQHIQENSPVLQRHLQRAQEIQQSLGRMPT